MLEAELKPAVQRLLEAKVQMKETERGPRLEVLNDYIRGPLSEYQEKIVSMPDDRNPDWTELNRVFRENVNLI